MRILSIILSLLMAGIISGSAQPAADNCTDAYGYLWGCRYNEAVKAFSECIENTSVPAGEDFLYRDFKDARTDFLAAREKGVSEADLWLARSYVTLDDYPQAIHILEEYLQNTSYPDLKAIRKDTVFRPLHTLDAWFQLWQKDWLSEDTKSVENARYYLEKYDFKSAHRVIEDNIKNSGNKALLYATSAEIYSKEDLTGMALHEIIQAISLQPDQYEYLVTKGDLLLKQNKFRDAQLIYTQSLEVQPMDFNVRVKRCEAAFRAGDLDLAKNDIDRILKYTDKPSISFLAARIAFGQANYTTVLKYINPLLKKDQSVAGYFKIRGMTYYKTRLYKQAAYDLSMSLDIDPEDGESNYYLGLTQNALGNDFLSCYYLKRAAHRGVTEASEYLNRSCEENEGKTTF